MDQVYNMVLKVSAEALWGAGGKPDIFIHVQGNYPPPVNPRFTGEGGQEFVLRRRRGKNYRHRLLFLQEVPDPGTCRLAGSGSHLFPGVEDFDLQTFDRQFSFWFFRLLHRLCPFPF